jgi:sulfide:quinone oxidoreductase
MTIRTIDSNFHVTGQINPKQMSGIAQQGYKTVICMRPDHEGFNQPVFADMAKAAGEAGLRTFYLPVVPGRMTASQVEELKNILSQAAGPVLAYCASGNRCASAYEMARRS